MRQEVLRASASERSTQRTELNIHRRSQLRLPTSLSLQVSLRFNSVDQNAVRKHNTGNWSSKCFLDVIHIECEDFDDQNYESAHDDGGTNNNYIPQQVSPEPNEK